MKKNEAVFDEKTQAKIDSLTAQYKDKKLSRSERKEAFRELIRVRYAADPRPSISVRKQAAMNMIFLFLDTLLFGCLTFAKPAMSEGIGSIFSLILAIAMLITVAFVFANERKYKKEPDDELSLNRTGLRIPMRTPESVSRGIYFISLMSATSPTIKYAGIVKSLGTANAMEP